LLAGLINNNCDHRPDDEPLDMVCLVFRPRLNAGSAHCCVACLHQYGSFTAADFPGASRCRFLVRLLLITLNWLLAHAAGGYHKSGGLGKAEGVDAAGAGAGSAAGGGAGKRGGGGAGAGSQSAAAAAAAAAQSKKREAKRVEDDDLDW
jgi:hypothetical protein